MHARTAVMRTTVGALGARDGSVRSRVSPNWLQANRNGVRHSDPWGAAEMRETAQLFRERAAHGYGASIG